MPSNSNGCAPAEAQTGNTMVDNSDNTMVDNSDNTIYDVAPTQP